MIKQWHFFQSYILPHFRYGAFLFNASIYHSELKKNISSAYQTMEIFFNQCIKFLFRLPLSYSTIHLHTAINGTTFLDTV